MGAAIAFSVGLVWGMVDTYPIAPEVGRML